MKTRMKLDSKGLDHDKNSKLTASELLRHLFHAAIIARLDSAAAGTSADVARLAITNGGTYVELQGRETPLEKTMSSTVSLINALARVAVEPSESAMSELNLAESEFDTCELKCLKSVIHEVCRSEKIEFQVGVGSKNITIRMPHKSIFSTPRKSTSLQDSAENRIRKIQPYTDVISSSGMAALIKTKTAMQKIDAGDNIAIRVGKKTRRFVQLGRIDKIQDK